ncbi:NADH-quinone oxidoreductase subunit E [Ahrensia sp. R2A130]|uniref:NADH-quinone oxidoreductase subunit E n=1 Tax=Ahrensia sp. R2A130 TaxID=744979 RepID=UPI0001E09408|nr:NADH-quinone oxidoreductase subunit E [Ahrensia sp. R2A130]EFL89991.1 NADH dehydrogenase subunit e [Ahrensia sp. R2A130]
MSVRRLADETVQPDAFKFSKANGAWAKKKIKDYPKGRQASAVIPLLMRAQEQEGWVTKAAIEHIAEMLGMPLIRVLEVATFYTQFQLAPVGKRAHVQVCGTTPCMLRGAGEIMDVCKKRIAPKPFELSEDGNLSWEEVECQGACVNAPMVMVFKDSYEDLTAERMEEIIDAFDAGNGDSIPPGPQIDRIYSAPIGGLTSLTEDPTLKGARKTGKGKKAEKQAATNAGRPASHASHNGAAIKSNMKPSTAKAAAEDMKEARKKAGTPSPKTRAKKLAENVKGEVEPADLRQPKPSEIKKAQAKKIAPKSSSLVGAGTATAKTKAKPAANAGTGNAPAKVRKPKTPDDLKMVSGIGPKIEGQLNELGVWTFAQVANWKKAERDWVNGYLAFKGRIEREDWVKQAKALAKGGRDEYVRVFGKEPR